MTGGRLLVALLAALILASPAPSVAQAPSKLAAGEAHAAAEAGKLTVVDIRTPAEWSESGVPASGHAISMNQPQESFLKQLAAATGNDKSKPIALICATGNRSASLQRWLLQAGYTSVSDIAEGMIGGPRGRGWIKSGLPVRKWVASAIAR